LVRRYRETGGRKDNVEMELSKTYSKYVNWFGFAEGVVSQTILCRGGDALVFVEQGIP